MNTWENDKAWSDRFLPEIKKILGLYLIGEASKDEDAKHNTDLVVLKMEAVRIAVRVRRPGYLDKYEDEFTIRAERTSGAITELAKIISGYGDYMFYGHSNNAETHLDSWALCDLKTFRIWFNSYIVKNGGEVPGTLKSNKDQSSLFRAFRFSDIGRDFIIARNKKASLCLEPSLK